MEKIIFDWCNWNWVNDPMGKLGIDDPENLSEEEILEFNKQLAIMAAARKAIRPLMLKAQGRFNPDSTIRLPGRTKL